MSKRSSPRSLCLSPADTSTPIATSFQWQKPPQPNGSASIWSVRTPATPNSHVCPTALAVAETRIGHFTQIVRETMMTAIETTDAGLSWDVLTIRRPGLTRDLPAGKEELMWVANSSTLIHGERDAVLVDTFLTIKQIADFAELGRRERQEPHRNLHHPRTWRSFFRPRTTAGALSARQGSRDTRGRQGHARATIAGLRR